MYSHEVNYGRIDSDEVKKIFKTLEDMEGDKIDVRVSILTLLDLDHYLVFI